MSRGQQVRAQAMHIEFNEKNSKYFLNKEISKAEIKNITTIDLDDGTKVKGQQNVIKCQQEYYQPLYTQHKTNNQWKLEESNDYFLNENDIPQINDEDKETLDNNISIDEIAQAVKDLPNSKSPGSDGLPIDFYKIFWAKIKIIAYESINYAITEGKMSNDQRSGILSLIPKKGKDIRKLKNWRLLTLLNSDYKIYTKALATRIQTVLPKIISQEQSGCIKGI